MSNNAYTSQQIEKIQISLISLLDFVKKYDKTPLPRALQFCEIIVRNIDICRENEYADIVELSELIQQDWSSAMHVHTGLPEYYIDEDVYQARVSINNTLHEHILEIDKQV